MIPRIRYDETENAFFCGDPGIEVMPHELVAAYNRLADIVEGKDN